MEGDETVKMPKVKMYTTQVCPYCQRAKMLLKQRGVDHIDEIRVDLNPAERRTMMQKWADMLDALARGAKVIPLQRKAK